MRKTWPSRYGARTVASYLPQLTRASLAAHGADARILTAARRHPRAPARLPLATLPQPSIALPGIADQALRHALERLGSAVTARATS